MWAVGCKRFTTLRRFLENGADINNDRIFRTYVDQKLPADSKLGVNVWPKRRPWQATFKWHPYSIFTPLAFAASLGLDSMVAFLVDYGADIEKPGKGLCACCDGENHASLSFPPYRHRGMFEDIEWLMDDESENCWTPLHVALCRGHESTAMILLSRGANPQVTCPCGQGPWNALHTATRLNQRSIIDYLLDNKLVNINEGGFERLTPLLIAFYEEHYSLVDMYIDRGADINAVWHTDDGDWTILAMACLRDEFDRASDLLRRGADPDFVLRDDEYGIEWTALGFIYGNLFGDYLRKIKHDHLRSVVTDTFQRRILEQQIIQVKVDKALQHQQKDKD